MSRDYPNSPILRVGSPINKPLASALGLEPSTPRTPSRRKNEARNSPTRRVLDSGSPIKQRLFDMEFEPPEYSLEMLIDVTTILDDFYSTILASSSTMDLIAIGLQGHVRFWSMQEGAGNVTDTVMGSRGEICCMTMSVDNNLAVGYSNGYFLIYDGKTRSPIFSFELVYGNRPTSCAWDARRDRLCVGDEGGVLHFFELNCKLGPSFCMRGGFLKAHHSGITAISYGGNHLVTSDRDGTVILHENTEYIPVFKRKFSFESAVRAINFCPWESKVFATGSGREDSLVTIYDAIEGSKMYQFYVKKQVTQVLWLDSWNLLVCLGRLKKRPTTKHTPRKPAVLAQVYSLPQASVVCECYGTTSTERTLDAVLTKNGFCLVTSTSRMVFYKWLRPKDPYSLARLRGTSSPMR